jgi:hypothetical protein
MAKVGLHDFLILFFFYDFSANSWYNGPKTARFKLFFFFTFQKFLLFQFLFLCIAHQSILSFKPTIYFICRTINKLKFLILLSLQIWFIIFKCMNLWTKSTFLHLFYYRLSPHFLNFLLLNISLIHCLLVHSISNLLNLIFRLALTLNRLFTFLVLSDIILLSKFDLMTCVEPFVDIPPIPTTLCCEMITAFIKLLQ